MKTILEASVQEVKELIFSLLNEGERENIREEIGEDENPLDHLSPTYLYDKSDGVFSLKEVSREHDRDDSCEVVYKVTHLETDESVLICWSGWDSSYGENEWYEPYFVTAKETVVTVYEKIK